MRKVLLNKTLKYTLITLTIGLLILSFIFCKSFYKKVVDSCIGLYCVYQGDKAYKRHDMQEAIDLYENGLRLFPHHYEAWYNLGNLYVVYEDYSSATQAYQNAILYNKKYTRARMNLGVITAEKLGKFDDAINQYQKIITAKKHGIIIPFIFNSVESEKYNKGVAYYNKGFAYSKKAFYLDETEKALRREYLFNAAEAYESAIKIFESDYDTSYNLALTYHLVGDYKKAGLNYCKAIETSPMHFEAHYNLAILLKHLKQYELAVDELEKATMLASTSVVNRSDYIIGILNDVSKMLILTSSKSVFFEDKDAPLTQATLNNGKIGYTETLDTFVLQNFQTCRSEPFFKSP